MLSLKKAATTGAGWSLNEITSIRHADESISLHTGYGSPAAQPPYDVARARKGFRPRGMETLEEGSPEVSEGIAMSSTKGSVESSR